MKSTIDHALYDPNQPLYQRFSTIQTQFDVTLGKIRALCSDSDIETLVNGDTTMYNRLANVELTATGLISDVSRVEAKYDAQSGQITTLQSDLSSFMQDESGFRQTVSSTYYTQENARIDKEALQGDISDISDDLEQNYSTTLQMQSAIEESARQIRLSVSETYATQVSLAQKNASYSGDAIPTNDNLPASQWNTDEEKRTHINDLYVTTDGKTYQYVQGIHGLRIKFDERCLLSSYVGNYVYIYYQLDGKTYRMPIMRRSELSGAVVFVPSNVFWLHFGSGSSSGEYGFKIESMEWKYDCVPSNAVEASLPSYSVVEVSGNTYPESSHPYEKNTNLFWKYTSSYSADSATTYGWADRNTRIDDIEERMSSAELKITNDAIVSTVRTSSSYLSDLSGKANTSDLDGLITADDAETIAESVIEQTADAIRLKADKIAWSSTNSSMTEGGILSCRGATIEGNLKTTGTYTASRIGNDETISFGIVEGIGWESFEHFDFRYVPSNTKYVYTIGYVKGLSQQTAVCADQGNGFARVTALAPDLYASIEEMPATNRNRYFVTFRELFDISNGTPRFRMTSNVGSGVSGVSGNIGITLENGSITATPSSLYIGSSNIRLSSTTPDTLYFCNAKVQMQSTSAKRYKENIEDLHNADMLPRLLYKLKPKQFRYLDEAPVQYPDMRHQTIPGFIAEDVAEIYPSAAIRNEDGRVESWDERRIIPAMLALIQEQHERINALESKAN